MESLLGKLTNLSYEIFGIFAPGVIGIVFFLFYWWALGDVPTELSGGVLPVFTYQTLRSHAYNSFDLIVLIVAAYFVGHLLFWLGRKHGEEQVVGWKRIGSCLLFKIPRPRDSFDAHHRPMLVATAAKLGIPDDSLTWIRFFPIAKVVLSQSLGRSLVSTYQNKYTLHRSITAAASLLFWTVAISASVLLFMNFRGYAYEPRWIAVIFGLLGSSVLVWGFSDSFGYNWKMFGNTLITETFAVVSGAAKVGRGGRED